jgi:hypothetical protein
MHSSTIPILPFINSCVHRQEEGSQLKRTSTISVLVRLTLFVVLFGTCKNVFATQSRQYHLLHRLLRVIISIRCATNNELIINQDKTEIKEA